MQHPSYTKIVHARYFLHVQLILIYIQLIDSQLSYRFPKPFCGFFNDFCWFTAEFHSGFCPDSSKFSIHLLAVEEESSSVKPSSCVISIAVKALFYHCLIFFSPFLLKLIRTFILTGKKNKFYVAYKNMTCYKVKKRMKLSNAVAIIGLFQSLWLIFLLLIVFKIVST